MRRKGKEIEGLQPIFAIRYICESEQAYIGNYLVISATEILIGAPGRQKGVEKRHAPASHFAGAPAEPATARATGKILGIGKALYTRMDRGPLPIKQNRPKMGHKGYINRFCSR